jgi:hypothetical protein
MASNLSLLKDRFPKWSRSIELLTKKNTSFQSLSDDYLLLTEQIRKHRDADPPISSADSAELNMLLTELEQEMIIYFEENRKGAKDETISTNYRGESKNDQYQEMACDGSGKDKKTTALLGKRAQHR